MKNTTPKPWLSTLMAVQEALTALVEVELPTIHWDANPDRDTRQQTNPEKKHGQPARSF